MVVLMLLLYGWLFKGWGGFTKIWFWLPHPSWKQNLAPATKNCCLQIPTPYLIRVHYWLNGSFCEYGIGYAKLKYQICFQLHINIFWKGMNFSLTLSAFLIHYSGFGGIALAFSALVVRVECNNYRRHLFSATEMLKLWFEGEKNPDLVNHKGILVLAMLFTCGPERSIKSSLMLVAYVFNFSPICLRHLDWKIGGINYQIILLLTSCMSE